MPLEYLSDVVTLRLDGERCIGCRMCLVVCPRRVFSWDGSKAEIRDRDLCMECGACKMNCPSGAIEVRSGVGCAYAILRSKLTGGEPSCGCSQEAPDSGEEGSDRSQQGSCCSEENSDPPERSSCCSSGDSSCC